MANTPLTFGSLFAGIGGFDLGFERAGMVCKWQVERDEYASGVLARHWPSVTRWREVETFPPNDGGDWSVDLICAGVPCQPISQAGKRKGTADERWMWGECLRVVATFCPRFFVAENPVNLLNAHESGSWPTPTSCDGKGATHPRHCKAWAKRGTNLPEAVNLAAAGDIRWPPPPGSVIVFDDNAKPLPVCQDCLEPHGFTGPLNPEWVEWLMGYPQGWTGCDALETQSCHKSQNLLPALSLKPKPK